MEQGTDGCRDFKGKLIIFDKYGRCFRCESGASRCSRCGQVGEIHPGPFCP